jgi:Protein of unknown function (DUF4012)
MKPRRRAHTRALTWRRRWLAYALIAVVAFLGLGGGAAAYLHGTSLEAGLTAEMKLGLNALEAGKATLKKASADKDVNEVKAATADFRAAEGHFRQVRHTLDTDPLLRLASAPGAPAALGGRLETASGAADLGLALSDAAIAGAGIEAETLAGGASTSARLMAVITALEAALPRLQSDVLKAKAASARIDVSLLPASDRATFTSTASTLEKTSTALTQASSLIPALKEIVGGNGQRTYLIEQLNPSELRSGGGFFGTYSVLVADQGNLTLAKGGELSTGGEDWPHPLRGSAAYVAPPDGVANSVPGYYSGHQSWSLEDTNYFADFASNSKWAIYFAQHSLNLKVDGVIAVDYYALQALLSLSGPITVPGFGVTLTPANFQAEVLDRSLDRDPSRKGFVSAAAGPLLQDVMKLGPDRWTDLSGILNRTIDQGHLQVFFSDQQAEAAMHSIGWSKDANPLKAADFLMETEDNYGANKVNYSVSRKYTVTLTHDGGVLHHHVVVDLIDAAPANAAYGSDYFCLARFYTGADATATKLASAPSREYKPLGPLKVSDVPAGLAVKAGWFYVNKTGGLTGRYELVFDYDTAWAAANGPHTMYWQKQPGTLADAFTIVYKDGASSWKGTGNLTQDVQVDLSSGGITVKTVGLAAAALPSFGL